MEQENNYNINNEINNGDKENQSLGKKRSFKIIFVVVFLICVLIFSFYYFFANKGEISENLKNSREKSEDIIQLSSILEETKLDSNNDCKSLYKESFLLNFVFGEYDYICPNLLPNFCVEKGVQSFRMEQLEEKNFLGVCNTICSIIKHASNDDKFYREVVKGWRYTEKYREDDTVYKDLPSTVIEWSKEYFYPWRVGLAYRLNKIEDINNICDFFDGDKKDECKDRSQYIINLLIDFENKCNVFLKSKNNY